MIRIHMVVTAKGGLLVVAHALGSTAYAISRRSTEICLWVDLAGRYFPAAIRQERTIFQHFRESQNPS